MNETIAPADPAALEREVIDLREECRRMLDELERRWLRVQRLPSLIGNSGRRAPAALARALRAHPILTLAAAALAAAALVTLKRRR